jgi:hypothetical protein
MNCPKPQRAKSNATSYAIRTEEHRTVLTYRSPFSRSHRWAASFNFKPKHLLGKPSFSASYAREACFDLYAFADAVVVCNFGAFMAAKADLQLLTAPCNSPYTDQVRNRRESTGPFVLCSFLCGANKQLKGSKEC